MSQVYRDRIVAEYENPRNFGRVDDPDLVGGAANGHCGDDFTFTARVEDGTLETVRVDGEGCAISTAAAAFAAERVEGAPVDDPGLAEDDLFDMLRLERTDITPMRLKCVLLARDGILSMVNTDDDA